MFPDNARVVNGINTHFGVNTEYHNTIQLYYIPLGCAKFTYPSKNSQHINDIRFHSQKGPKQNFVEGGHIIDQR